MAQFKYLGSEVSPIRRLSGLSTQPLCSMGSLWWPVASHSVMESYCGRWMRPQAAGAELAQPAGHQGWVGRSTACRLLAGGG